MAVSYRRKRNQQKLQLLLPFCLALTYSQNTVYIEKFNFNQFVVYARIKTETKANY